MHKVDQPDIVVDFLDADRLVGEDRTEIYFFAAQIDFAAMGDHDGFVVKRIVDVGQPGVAAGRGLIDLRRAFHVQGFVRTLAVEDFHEVIEARLLLYVGQNQIR
jgi:hypothetical protein